MNQPSPDSRHNTGKHKWLRRSLLTLLIFIVIIVLVRLTLPYSIIFGANTWLEKQGISSTIEDIRIDVLDGKFTLVNAKGTAGQQPVFNVGLVDIHWQWRPLSDKVIHIEHVALQDLDLDIQQYSDAIVVAGIQVPLGAEKPAAGEPAGQDDSISWAASLSEVDFSGLNVCYQQFESTRALAAAPVLDYCTAFSALGWSGRIGFATDRELAQQQAVPLISDGDFKLSEFSVTDRRLGKILLDARNTELKDVRIRGLDLVSIGELDIGLLSAMQRDDNQHRNTLQFSELRLTGIQLKNMNAIDINGISLDSPVLYIVKNADAAWEYEQWLPALSKNGDGKDGGTAFLVALHQIQIDGSDFCYNETASRLFYCFMLDSLSWKGAAAIDNEPLYVTGELQLAGLNINNRTLQRNLLAIKQVSATGIDIKELGNAAVGGLVVDQLSALQRSENANDNSLKFDRLDVSTLAYTGGSLLEINKINLGGIGISLSMNADGAWEHDKWKTSTVQSPDIDSEKAEQTPADDTRLDIVVGEFNLVTDQQLTFVDQSTTPPLDLGLRHIDFNIRQLDSRKPEQRSHFSLNAATTRHGTIQIAGDVSPFETKPSFDAKGRIAGLDLRALTPATKKHIGHIVRSGQLDADLKLLSVDGQLDSNIGLVLHQFEFKAMSDKDAHELEQTFGMPINQSLSLLRDKDNSIHLDIPITGDVTAPDFDPTDAIIKATSKAATFTLITFYTPYGLVFAGGNLLLDLATALNFDPLMFDPGSAKLNRASIEQLEKLSELMTERPQVHMTLCGQSSGKDANLLYPKLKVDEKTKKIVLNHEQEARLLQLAQDRQTSIKNYLIEKKGITHDRLILCEPAYDQDEDAVGGVEINI